MFMTRSAKKLFSLHFVIVLTLSLLLGLHSKSDAQEEMSRLASILNRLSLCALKSRMTSKLPSDSLDDCPPQIVHRAGPVLRTGQDLREGGTPAGATAPSHRSDLHCTVPTIVDYSPMDI